MLPPRSDRWHFYINRGGKHSPGLLHPVACPGGFLGWRAVYQLCLLHRRHCHENVTAVQGRSDDTFLIARHRGGLSRRTPYEDGCGSLRGNRSVAIHNYSQPGFSKPLVLSFSTSRNPDATFGQFIRKARLEKVLRQVDVAEAVGVDEMTIVSWERSSVVPTRPK